MRIPLADTTLEVQAQGELRLGPTTLYPNAMHYLRYDYEVPVEAMNEMIEVKAGRAAAGEPRIVNSGSAPIDLYLVEDDHYRHVQGRSLRPGEEKELVDVDSSPRQEISGLQNASYPYSFSGSDPSDIPQAVLNKVLAAVARPHSELMSLNYPGELSPSTNPWRAEAPRYLIALTQSPIFPAIPSVPVRKAITAVVIELPPRAVE